MEKEMATHSSVLAWRIPGMAEPGGLLSVGSHRVRHDWSDLAYIWENTFGFYKWHSLAFLCFSVSGHHMHSKQFFIPTYTYERIHRHFMNYIHKYSSIFPRDGSISTINIYWYSHIPWRKGMGIKPVNPKGY